MSFPSGENPGTAQQTSIAHRNFGYYIPLYKAAPEGNWDSAKRLFGDDSSALTAALRIQDCGGYTALHHAAIVGSLRYAVALVRKNPSLTNVLDANGRTPLLVGSRYVYESSRKLHTLDLSWCRNLTDKELSFIVDRCLSLMVLKLFGYTQITDVFLNGHSNSEYLDLKLDALGYSVCLSPEDENQLRNPKIA
ncbi:Ankyrin repeat-containing protein [Trema orientale]|uniref:Ankyrin repeat-containing protein n=1 Tax=Trema orientale TaxID=63057 RepID=A0A2P5C3L4_TREOI|nr:Ankyrin repeat-containing protein [Trema orientale]